MAVCCDAKYVRSIYFLDTSLYRVWCVRIPLALRSSKKRRARARPRAAGRMAKCPIRPISEIGNAKTCVRVANFCFFFGESSLF